MAGPAFLSIFAIWFGLILYPSLAGTYYVVKVGLCLIAILLFHSPTSWDYRCEAACLTPTGYMKDHGSILFGSGHLPPQEAKSRV